MKGENSIKLYGNDLEALEKTAYQIKDRDGDGARHRPTSPYSMSLGQPTVNIEIDRPRAARYGLAPGRHQRDGPGGHRRPGRRQPVRRWQRPQFPDRRAPGAANIAQNLDAMRHIPIGAPNPNGNGIVPIPLSDVAKVKLVSGCFLHLSRKPGALHPDQIQRARPRSRQRRARGAAQGRRTGPAARAATASNGWASSASCRRRCSGSRWSCRSASLLIGVLLLREFRLARRHAARRQRHADGADRRHLRARPSPARLSACRPPSASSRCSASRRWTASSCCRTSTG